MKITIQEDWLLPNGKYQCPHCKKEYTKNGIATHIWRSHGDGQNHKTNIGVYPEHIKKLNEARKLGEQIWNKGLTKETDERVKKNTELAINYYKNNGGNTKGKKIHSDEFKQKVSERQSTNNSGGRSKWFEIDGVYVQGTWERDCVLKFNDLGIDWKKVKKEGLIRYSINERQTTYTPDIYLPEFDITLEIKGYWWGNDEEKMKYVLESNPHLGNKIYFVFKDEFDRIKKAKSKSELNVIINNLTSLRNYFL